MKKILILFAVLFLSLPFAIAENEVHAYLFYGKTCPHCRAEKVFLDRIAQKYPSLEIHELEVYYDSENSVLFSKMCQAYGTKPYGVPTTFIGDDYIIGYGGDSTTGREIENRIKDCIKTGCIDPGEKIGLAEEEEKTEEEIKEELKTKEEALEIAKTNSVVQELLTENPNLEPSITIDDKYIVTYATKIKVVSVYIDKTTGEISKVLEQGITTTNDKEENVIDVPLIGKIDVSEVGLPLFTVIIGGLDGFNPCAMWVLCFLLTLLIRAQSRKKMLLIGGIFVFVSALVYFIFMTAWLNFFLLVGYVNILRIIIALIAVIVGLINMKDFFFFKKGISLTIPEAAKPKLFEKMRYLVHETALPAVILGTIILAFTANTFELLCTAGFPAIYTRVLTLKALPTATYYLYLALYNIVYVIPLAIIVSVFSITMGAHRFTEKQGRWLKLIGGLLMLILGLILLLKPELLTFV